MGLIRGSLAIGSLGLVSPDSKKQRIGKAIARNTAVTAKNTAAANRLLEQQAAADAEYRYVSDPVWRAHVDQQRALAAEQERLRLERQARQRHQRGVLAFQAIVLPLLAVAFAGLAVAVWAPQQLVGKISGEPRPHFMRRALTDAWAAAVHRQ